MSSTWPWYALVAMICFSGMQLVFKHLSRGGLSPAAILVFVFGVGWMLYVIHVAMLRTTISTNPTVLAFLLAAGALGYVGNLCAVRAMALAPNPGYALAIAGLHSLVVTLVSAVLLGASLSWIKLVGVMLCVAGISLLVL